MMDHLAKFIEGYDSTQVDQLPKVMKRRLDALKKLQLQHVDLSLEYHKEIQQIEMKYEKLYQPLYEKRAKIISGEYEPTDQECQLPPGLDDEPAKDQENSREFKPDELKTLDADVKGIPGFWLGCLASSSNFSDSIEDHDRPVLKHLKDIKLVYGEKADSLTYTLEFVFDENPYFSNKVLTKTYHLKLKPDEKDPFSFDGFEVTRAEGCKIDWFPGKDCTSKTVTVKQQNKHDGRTREKKKEIEQDSFFYFFNPPEVNLSEDTKEIDQELGAIISVDFELGEVLRQSVVPRACLYYSGLNDDEFDDDDDDDDEDEDDDDEDDISSVEDSDSLESNQSDDDEDDGLASTKKR